MTDTDAIAGVLGAHWGLRSPFWVEELTAGVNNASHLVGHDTGDFVLKGYRNVDAMSRLPFEHALLGALANANLPFAVPVPLPTTAGELIAVGHDGQRHTLTRRIPGVPGWRGDLALTIRAGRALAVLDRALATIEPGPGRSVPDACPPLGVSDSRIACALGGDHDLVRELVAILDRAERQMAMITAGWPIQIIHADYFPPNVLVDDGKISGVIDFEFAGTGHLAMDVAIGLVAFGAEWGTFSPHLDRMEAFATGYFETGTLSTDELSAMPALLLRREAGSFTHWLGRTQQGLIGVEDLRARGQRLLDLDAWLTVNGNELVRRLSSIGKDRQR